MDGAFAPPESSDNRNATLARRLGIVVIGRNEGDRLTRCLRSVSHGTMPTVYVDSGSSDGSIENARALGADVVELDMRTPFTAARARNAGFARLLELVTDVEYVQFVDGDCEVIPGWFDAALEALESDATLAAVCGQIRERFPERSVYNALCNLEWDAPAGVVSSCGGNSMMRVSSFRAAGGFEPSLIAGEEPDLCQRLRNADGTIRKLPVDMVLHDTDLLHYSQWWKRSVRWGYAAAQLAHLHGGSSGLQGWRPTLNCVFWGVGFPFGIVAATRLSPAAWVGFVAYPVRVARLYLRKRRCGVSRRLAVAYALLNTADKCSELLGASRYLMDVITGHRTGIIEHKRIAEAPNHK